MQSFIPFFVTGPPTPSSGRPGSSSSTEWQYRGGRGKRKRRDDDGYEECKRSTMLGDVAAEKLTTQFERDIYDVVDHLITQAVIMVDGLSFYCFFKNSF